MSIVSIIVDDGKKDVVKTVTSPDSAYDAVLWAPHHDSHGRSFIHVIPNRRSPTAQLDVLETDDAVDNIKWADPRTLVITFRQPHVEPAYKPHEVTIQYR